jgi:DNA repair protein RadD
MITLRPYQTAAVDSLWAFWAERSGNPLIVLPTGTGKSLVLGDTCRQIREWPDTKILVVTHVQELVEQNFLELVRMWPQCDAGINSAGLARRDTRNPIIFCSIQSVWRHAQKFQKVDILIVDEAHLIPTDGSSMYQTFIADLLVINPHMKVVGLTATAFRLDTGRLDTGSSKMFDGISYEYPLRQAVDEGYLCPLVSKATDTSLDLTGVRIQGGEFKAGDLAEAVDKASLNEGVAREILHHGKDRKSWLVFSSGVEHAQHLCGLLEDAGVPAAVIHAGTDKAERRQHIADFKAKKLRALCSMNVLTTGFNAPGVDLIAMVRPTQSAGLYVQMAGRGTRPVYAPGHDLTTEEGRRAAIAAGKPNCLVLDFANNIVRHGPVDDIRVKDRNEKGAPGDAPVKVCPECKTFCHASARQCLECGHEFPEPRPRYTAVATTAEVMRTGPAPSTAPVWISVIDVTVRRHEKPGKIPSMRVTYFTKLRQYDEWVCVEHDGYARDKAVKWWRSRGGQGQVPSTVNEALDRVAGLKQPAEILVRPRGEFFDIVGVRGEMAGGAVRDMFAGDDVVPF